MLEQQAGAQFCCPGASAWAVVILSFNFIWNGRQGDSVALSWNTHSWELCRDCDRGMPLHLYVWWTVTRVAIYRPNWDTFENERGCYQKLYWETWHKQRPPQAGLCGHSRNNTHVGLSVQFLWCMSNEEFMQMSIMNNIINESGT